MHQSMMVSTNTTDNYYNVRATIFFFTQGYVGGGYILEREEGKGEREK